MAPRAIACATMGAYHFQKGSDMTDPQEGSGPGSDETRAHETTARAAESVGPYRLIQPLGEGGMGIVWLAEQVRPVRRQVALKIIKAGMDTAQVVARFEAERQAPASSTRAIAGWST